MNDRKARFKLIVGPDLRFCDFVDLKTGESIPTIGFEIKVQGYSSGRPAGYDSGTIVTITLPPGFVVIEGSHE